MRQLLLLLICCWLLPAGSVQAAGSYRLEKLADGVYAALAQPGGQAISNALIVAGDQYAVVAGAHLSREAINELIASVASVTPAPIRYFVLTHHHSGYSNVDFDFPTGKEIIMSWQTWQQLDRESRELNNPVLFFSEGMTLKLGNISLVLTDLEQGHAEGNLVVFVPEASTVYTGDLLAVGSVGWMGDGRMQDWILGLEFIESLDARKVVPGQGPVVGNPEVAAYKDFLRDFLTEILHHIEKGESLKQTIRRFKLPRYQNLADFGRFREDNIRRAYEELKPLANPRQ